ncbi:MAG: glycosyltransferase, exosortase A system-associated [Blastocatellia bacterium]|nr:glycosyltransferase, exosortase A system-associated [Blastocatellia bacterium]
MKVLHVLDHSLPYFSGYSFRSDYIIRAQKGIGLDPVVVTSPKHEDFTNEHEEIDEVDFYRVRWPAISSARLQTVPLVKQMACVAVLSKEITKLAEQLQVAIIHSHSPFLNGLAAARSAEQLGLPWIYELRYYDEDAAVDRGKIKHNSLRYKLSQRMEQSALEQATRIVTISTALKDDLIGRGIEESKISEVPNGVDTGHFQPREADAELSEKYGLTGRTVIGFIGSFYFYEGLEFLIEAVLILLKERRDLKLLLVGEGEAQAGLETRIPEGLRDHFIFTGNVAHKDVRRYYSVMDILVYPRVKSRLTELTTPLKPLEAMAMGKVVVGSDTGGIRELVKDGANGFLVGAQNAEALASRLAKLAGDLVVRRDIGRQAREFVLRERDWKKIVGRYPDIYGRAMEKSSR